MIGTESYSIIIRLFRISNIKKKKNVIVIYIVFYENKKGIQYINYHYYNVL